MSLSQLKQIRSQRVERRHTELQREKAAFSQAEIKLTEAKESYRKYCTWRLDHQKHLFEKLQSGDFYPEKINQYNQNLEKLKEKELALKEIIPAFEVEHKASFERLEKSKQVLQVANKDMEKVEEFIKMERAKSKDAEEKQEEELADEMSNFKSSQK